MPPRSPYRPTTAQRTMTRPTTAQNKLIYQYAFNPTLEQKQERKLRVLEIQKKYLFNQKCFQFLAVYTIVHPHVIYVHHE